MPVSSPRPSREKVRRCCEGETTAMYLTKLIKPLGVRLTRIGVGIPVGSNLDYADSPTLSKAMDSRREI